jgi:hypothetical protein
MLRVRYLIIILSMVFVGLETIAANPQEKSADAQGKAPRRVRSMSADFHNSPVGNQQRAKELGRKEVKLADKEVIVNAKEAIAKRYFRAAKASERRQQTLFHATQLLLAQIQQEDAKLKKARLA